MRCPRTLLWLFLAAAVAAGCREKPAGPADAGRPPSGPTPAHVAWQQAKIDHARLTALAANRAAYQRDLEHKYVRMWDGLQIEAQIPYEPALPALRASLERHAAQARLELVAFEAEPIPPALPEDRTIPAVLGPDAPFSWHQDELVGRTRITLKLAPSDLERLEGWWRSRGQIGRRVRVESVVLGSDAATASLLVYHYHPKPPVPERRQPAIDADAVLSKAGVPEGTDDPKIAEVRRLYGEVASELGAINEALGYRQQAELWDARYAYFFALVQETDAQRWSQVLR